MRHIETEHYFVILTSLVSYKAILELEIKDKSFECIKKSNQERLEKLQKAISYLESQL